ncbi:starch-binding protein [Ruminococcus sp.]|uniref:starch-binding protein n=1 Tax=Ruminococcus sp. TaxID=41978 RepID=UPI00386CD384
MGLTGKQTKRAISLLLCLAVLVSVLTFALTVRAEELPVAGTDASAYDGSSNLTRSKDLAGTGANLGYVYCKNTAGWSTVNAYMWIKDTQTNNAAWPGKAMTKVSGTTDVWRYEVTNSSWNMIIFNNGSAQTDDLDYPGAGYIYDNTTKQWSVYETQPTTVQPTQGGGTNPTTAPQPTQGGSTTGKNYVYCENEAGWGTVTVYMWNSTSDTNAAWPGVAMTNIGGNEWRYEVPKSFKNVIFSNNGQSQTEDLTFPGKDYMWNNKTKTWSIRDTSPLQISSFATDLASPQYNGTGIILSAEAEGEGTVYYKFSVTFGSSTTVLSDFSTSNKAVWTPQTAGTYTLTYDFKDAKGNTNKRTKEYVIEDGSAVVAPYIKTVTPNSGDIQNGSNVQISVAAGGGKTGTNLLFYKYTIKNPSDEIANVPYYTRNTSYTFKPTALGLHTLTVNVQGSDNKTVERSYVFNSVGAVTPTTPPETQPDVQPTTAPPAPTQVPPAPTQAPKPTTAPPAPTQAPTESFQPNVLYGDADDDGEVTILDVTVIQRYRAGIIQLAQLNERNADVDGDDDVTILDATLIQRYRAGIISKFPAES